MSSAVFPTLRQDLAELPLVRRVRLYARRYTLWMRFLWSKGLAPGEQGLVITHAEIDRILESRESLGSAEAAFYEQDEQARALGADLAEADHAVAGHPRWQSLIRCFALSEPEADLLMLAAAVDLDPWLRRVYAYLHDDATLGHASQWLARELFSWPGDVRLGADSSLARWLLARPGDSFTAAWTIDPFLTRWLLDPEATDAALGTAASVVAAPSLVLYPEELARTEAILRDALSGGSAVQLEIAAGPGSGKRTFAAQLCTRLRRPMLAVDARPPLNQTAHEHAIRATRLARLHGAVLYWHHLQPSDAHLTAAPEPVALTILSGTAPMPLNSGALRHTVPLPALTADQRCTLWARLAPGPAPAVIREWQLTPQEIVQAAKACSGGPQAVQEVCARLVRSEPGELFAPLPCPYTWDDIVLPENVETHLKEFEAHAQLRRAVLDDWGFSRLMPLGRGVSALFAGPSGTGKTMAAQVIASSLGMELYRVDLAGVINKYIGETEKRLKQVFAACERANVMLFFDEADALFGQRMQVKDAHDRFANIEIDYLLQRMEQFNGIAVLATNRKSDIDRAFLRRLRFIIDFVQPGPTERLALWRKSLPETTPAGLPLTTGIDWERLAAKVNLTGADIKSAALGAAFLARQEGNTIEMKHIRRAIAREMTKQGYTLREGDWEN